MSIAEAPVIEYYYDNHILEDDVPESNFHTALIEYLGQVLDWHYHEDNWFISRDLFIYQTDNEFEKPAAPDIAVFIGVDRADVDEVYIKSWKLHPPLRPAPHVVIEIASDGTDMRDTDEKPGIYANTGVAEYIWYDPRPERPEDEEILRGWRFPEKGRQQEMECDERGWMWSAELQSWLVPDGRYLRICDRQGRQRLTKAEALEADNKTERRAKEEERRAKEAERRAKEEALFAREVERAAKEAERKAKEEALAAREAEQVAKEAEQAAKEAEQAAKEAEQAAKERAWARLREIGIDPEDL